MAVLQNIREKCGVLVIVIVGLALLAFLLGDFLSGGTIGRGDRSTIAKINGSKVDYTEWQANYNNHRTFVEVAQQGNITSDTEKQLRETAWTDIINTYVWNEYYEEVGLSVSDEELEDLLMGPKHAHSIIVQNFNLQADPTTGEYDINGPKSFFERADEDANYKVIADYWKTIIKQDQISTKYNNMLTKGFYTPTALAKMYYEDMTNTSDFVYAYREYTSIKDEEIAVTDEALTKYYEEHKNRFIEENDNRDLRYVVLDVTATPEDVAELKANLEELRTEIAQLQSDTLNFAMVNSSNSRPEDRQMYKDGAFMTLGEAQRIGLNEEFFNAENGTISEIVTNGNVMLFAEILDNTTRPDSVNASHILLQPKDSTQTIETCKAIADSLATVLKAAKGDSAMFAQMAATYSVDGSKDKGGSLGDFTEGMMIPVFNDACFTNPAGSIQVVESMYGVHVIKINSQTAPVRKVKLAVVDMEIKNSDRTYESVFQKANTFYASAINEDFDSVATKQGLNVRIASKVTDMSDNIIAGIDNSREIVRWAFDEDRILNDVSTVFESSNRDKFIVAKVSSIREKGFTPFEDTKLIIEPEVKKELKAAKMMEEIKGMDVATIASKFNARTDTLTNISFASFSLPGLGLIEPKINATATVLNAGEQSEAIQGNNGVYVIKVINKTAAPEKQDFDGDKLAKMREASNNFEGRMYKAMQKAIKLDDNRAKFF